MAELPGLATTYRARGEECCWRRRAVVMAAAVTCTTLVGTAAVAVAIAVGVPAVRGVVDPLVLSVGTVVLIGG